MIPKELYYQDLLIAYLSDSQLEWPRSDSIYQLADNLPSNILAFIESSIKSSRLIENNNEIALQLHIKNSELKFIDIINSKDWYIKDEIGKKYGILSPIFHPNNIIVWMGS